MKRRSQGAGKVNTWWCRLWWGEQTVNRRSQGAGKVNTMGQYWVGQHRAHAFTLFLTQMTQHKRKSNLMCCLWKESWQLSFSHP